MSNKPIDAYRDNEHNCVFVLRKNGSIQRLELDDEAEFWFEDDDEDENDPEGVVWAALTGKATGKTTERLDRIRKMAQPLRRSHKQLGGKVDDLKKLSALLEEIFVP